MVRGSSPEHRRARVRAGPLLVSLLLILPAAAPAYDTGAEREAAYISDSDCLECHDGYDLEKAIHGTLHESQTRAAATSGCQSCHGPGSIHADSGEPADILNPATADPDVSNRLCLQCHRADAMDAFEASTHAMTDVTCTSCHTMHAEDRAPLLQADDPDLCYSCHEDVRSASYLPSHHPVKEGRMNCSDCHDPHGADLHGVEIGDRPNDLCLSCHAQHQGPFIFEHSPVVEDCSICHTPHGAVANNLLVQNEPFLCLQCHQMHFHTTIPGIDGEFTSLDGYGGLSTRDGSKRAMLTKCTQCHTEVHGSDLPSQSISGEGRALTR